MMDRSQRDDQQYGNERHGARFINWEKAIS
jgi:hypothetical protein